MENMLVVVFENELKAYDGFELLLTLNPKAVFQFMPSCNKEK